LHRHPRVDQGRVGLFEDAEQRQASLGRHDVLRGEKKVWQIVGEPEADANKGKISVASPIARALIGKIKGDIVEVETPGGAKTYKVRKVEWLENGPEN
jgi:transcription elongation GreA/GreB family factor